MVTDATKLTSVEQFVRITAPPMPYLIVAGRSVFRAGDSHERRTLPDTFVVILVHSGVLHMQLSGIRIDVKPQQFLLLPPGFRHGGYAPCESTTIFSWLHFHVDGTIEYIDRRPRRQGVISNKNLYYRKNEFSVVLPLYGSLSNNEYEFIQSDFKEIEQALIDRYQRTKRFRRLRLTELTCQSRFLSVLSTISETNVSHDDGGDDDLPARVSRYLHDHYTLPLTVREVARVFQCDSSYLSRAMHNRYGMSTLRLLMSIRVEEAKKLLEHTDVPIRDVSKDVGFDTPSYFAKRFREYTGVSPAEWRESRNPAFKGQS